MKELESFSPQVWYQMYKKPIDLIFNRLFDDLVLELLEQGKNKTPYYNWWKKSDFVSPEKRGLPQYENIKPVFAKNWWGRFWIQESGCELLERLEYIKDLLDINQDRFDAILIYYLNQRYSSEFGDRIIKDIGDSCREYNN